MSEATLLQCAPQPRPALTVMLGVWRALILREAGTRLFAGRIAWAWVLGEPAFHVGYLLVLYTWVSWHKVAALDTGVWLVLGLQGYFLFRKTADAIARPPTETVALLAYAPVAPLDPPLARAVLEGALAVVVTVLMLAGLMLGDHPFASDRPLQVLGAMLALWLFGIGFGLLAGVMTALVAEARIVLTMVLRPLYLISGVVFPLAQVPEPWRRRLMWNPVANGVELARQGCSRFYHAVPETSAAWLWGAALGSVVLGLLLQRHFADRICGR